MGFFSKISVGWELAVSSIKVLKANKQIIIFPIMSGLSLILVTGSFGLIILSGANWNVDNIQLGRLGFLLVLFLYYIINYFIIVFFNMALINSTRQYFDGQKISISGSLQFSASRFRVIFLWAVFSATGGVILKIAQNNLGSIGRIVSGGLGLIWSVGTFLVVPVIAYENLGPIDAVKRSVQLMKEKWGEGIGASFSISLILVLPMLMLAIGAYAISYYINDTAGILLFVTAVLCMSIVASAVNSILISVLYQNINGSVNMHFRQQLLDGLFEKK